MSQNNLEGKNGNWGTRKTGTGLKREKGGRHVGQRRCLKPVTQETSESSEQMAGKTGKRRKKKKQLHYAKKGGKNRMKFKPFAKSLNAEKKKELISIKKRRAC